MFFPKGIANTNHTSSVFFPKGLASIFFISLLGFACVLTCTALLLYIVTAPLPGFVYQCRVYSNCNELCSVQCPWSSASLCSLHQPPLPPLHLPQKNLRCSFFGASWVNTPACLFYSLVSFLLFPTVSWLPYWIQLGCWAPHSFSESTWQDYFNTVIPHYFFIFHNSTSEHNVEKGNLDHTGESCERV